MQSPLKFIVVIILVMAVSGCVKKGGANKEVVTIKGSDTMVNLTQKWAESYMKKYNDLTIQVTGGGSGTGIASLLNGTASIANISRELKEKEYSKATERGITPNKIKVALDGIAVIVNPENKIDSLTLHQIKQIFSGEITNWKDLGGSDNRIILYGRENSSGTYEYFKQTVLKNVNEGNSADFSTSTQVLQGTAALGEAVSHDVNGIGYGGVGYFVGRNDLKIIPIKPDESTPAISPSINGNVNYNAIWEGVYPLSRYLYCFTDGKPKGALKNYIDYILSKEGQSVVQNMEYIPLPSVLENN